MRRQRRARGLRGALACAAVALAGCVAGPDYRKPEVELPVTWKVDAPWRESRPDDGAPKGPWWQRFGDAQLNALAETALGNNPTLAIFEARLAQSRAQLAATSAAVLPQVGLNARATRQKISANRPLSNYATPNFSTVQNDLALAMSVNYEFDVAGRIRRSIESAGATLEQAGADLENARLLLISDLATSYYNVRALDIELDVVNRAIALQRRALDLVTARYQLGAATGLDVAQQQALLDNTLVQVDVLQRQRDQFEHALATLVGVAAPSFALAPDVRELNPPTVPLGVPSDVLERRPDIAAAERAMAAANAQIGVATAAFYPSVTLGPTLYGVESHSLSTLFDAPSVLWSIGLSATQVLFDNGRLKANVDFARAGHAVAIANYRRIVLIAMQEAEDGITGLASLERASTQARTAVATARRVLEMSAARYEGGASGYLDVITAQQALLNSARQVSQLDGQRMLTSVFLIKALGGDWQREAPIATSRSGE